MSLLDALEVRHVTLGFSEWGAAVGLGWAVARPASVGRLFVMNSPFPERPAGRVRLPPPILLFRLPLVGELTVKGLGAFTRGFLFKASMVHRERMTPAVQAAYLAPHLTWASRTSVRAFPRQIPRSPDDLVATLGAAAQATLRGELRGRPARLVWALRDVSFSEAVLDRTSPTSSACAITSTTTSCARTACASSRRPATMPTSRAGSSPARRSSRRWPRGRSIAACSRTSWPRALARRAWTSCRARASGASSSGAMRTSSASSSSAPTPPRGPAGSSTRPAARACSSGSWGWPRRFRTRSTPRGSGSPAGSTSSSGERRTRHGWAAWPSRACGRSALTTCWARGTGSG